MNRDVRNCRRCGKIMIYVGIPLCEECLKKEEEYYEAVRRYLDEHPRSSVREISEATSIPAEVIMKFVRQGSLVALENVSGMLACEICGKPIKMGRVCPECAEALMSATGNISRRPGGETGISSSRTQSKMYSMDMITRRRGPRQDN